METKIEYLFDEIGKIDDKFVNEAMLLYEKPKRPKRALGHVLQNRGFSRGLSIVAAVALVFTLSLVAVANFGNLLQLNKADKENSQAPSSPYEYGDRLFAKLSSLDAKALDSMEVTGNVSDLLYGSTARLIWTFGDGVYYSVTVNNTADEAKIKNYLKNDSLTKVSPNEEPSDFRFWISHGSGVCTIPYLERNGGRESFGMINDYLPEVYPSNDFAEFIFELIKDQI